MSVELREAVELVSRLVAINSINPSLVPAAAGEAEIAAFAAGYLQQAGLEVHVEEAAPGRPSVIGVLRGRGGGRSLMLNGHLDTVGVQGMENPFAGRLEGGRLYGRGAYDMKGPDAAAMLAACELSRSGARLAGDVLLALVCDEEHASLGTAAVAARWRADAAVVVEPSEMYLILAHKGFVWGKVRTIGRAAHGSRFDEGLDAIVMAGKYLAQFDAYEKELRSRPGHPLVGPPSVHASIIQGGQELSSYPAECAIEIERRTIPGETSAAVADELQGLARKVASADGRFNAEVSTYFERAPSETAPNAPIARAVSSAVARQLGAEPEVRGAAYWMDMALLIQAGIPSVCFGPGGAGAHAATEYVLMNDVVRCAEIYADLAREWCR